jgi:hypothetical protein
LILNRRLNKRGSMFKAVRNPASFAAEVPGGVVDAVVATA